MRARGCRLAHFHETFGAGLGLAAAAAAEVPIRVLSRPADSSPLEGKLPFASIDAFVAGSDGVRSILARGGIAQDRIEVVPPGLDFSRFTPNRAATSSAASSASGRTTSWSARSCRSRTSAGSGRSSTRPAWSGRNRPR